MFKNALLLAVVLIFAEGCDQWGSTVPSQQFKVLRPFGPPPPFPGSKTAQGSGCRFSGDRLPDGVWFGYVNRMDVDALYLDVACYYLNDAARAQALQKGDEPPPNLFYVVNDEKRFVRVPVVADAVAYKFIDLQERIVPLKTSYEDMRQNPSRYMPCPHEFCTVWVYMNHGVATEVQSQYFP